MTPLRRDKKAVHGRKDRADGGWKKVPRKKDRT